MNIRPDECVALVMPVRGHRLSVAIIVGTVPTNLPLAQEMSYNIF
jgi:hypothetical protein